uniref:Uncharacterized protein n=1 Tax=Anguilla anguilla TaxID=7936 RepID=A0A0E9SHU1_ANGAN
MLMKPSYICQPNLMNLYKLTILHNC